jgi:glycosyltransferase involved in cell wall biosynthesis
MNPLFGGSQERVFQMSKFLGDLGVQVDILTTSHRLDRAWLNQLKCGELFVLDSLYCRYLFPFGAKKWLNKNMHKYDAVHIAKNWCFLASIASRVASEQGVPYVFSAMGFVSVHNRSRILKKLFFHFFTKSILSKAHSCIAVTADEQTDLLNAGVPQSKIHIIPNGIVPQNLNVINDHFFRSKYRIGDRKILLFIGRMDPIKGVHLLIDAFVKIKDQLESWCLVLIGTDTEYRNYLQRYVISLGFEDSVIFLNPIFGAEKSMAYHAAEIVAIPSIKDAMTIIAPEAAFCGKPVLITKFAGFNELTLAGGSIEVEPTSESIANGLLLMCGDKVNLKSMGMQGKNFVSKNFNWQFISRRYYDIFNVLKN